MTRIKIVSGWSHYGGSTQAHINLCNTFNDRGIDCTYYGPHEYHLDKCKAKLLKELKLEVDDVLIYHFLDILKERPPINKLILSLHEKDLYPLKHKPYQIFDSIHYLNERQKQWHGVEHNNFICPNAHEEFLDLNNRPKHKIAGVIGSIDENKQTHISIKRALEDGMEKIFLFGSLNDVGYFQREVEPLIVKHKDIIEYKGFVDDKQKMYEMVSDVYLSSISENASFVADECSILGVKFHGNEQTDINQNIISNDEVFAIWMKNIKN
jgi:hypothetical protein